MLMPHRSRLTGRRRVIGHFRSKLNLAYLDSTINKTLLGGDRHGAVRTPIPHIKQTSHCNLLTWEMHRALIEGHGECGLAHVPREPAFKKHIQGLLYLLLNLPEDDLGSAQVCPWLQTEEAAAEA